MDILMTTPSFFPETGGVAEVAYKQYEFLRQRGHRVHVLTAQPSWSNESLDSKKYNEQFEELSKNITHLNVKAGRFPFYAAGDVLGIQNSTEKRRYIYLIEKRKFDVVLCHCWQAWNTDWLFDAISDSGRQCEADVVKKATLPLVLFSHGTSVNTLTGWMGALRYLRWRGYAWRRMPRMMRAARAVVMLDNWVDSDRFWDGKLAFKLGIEPVIVPNGCQPELLRFQSKVKNHPTCTKLMICIAQYSRGKNPAAVVRAFANANPPGWRLVVCGAEETPYLQALRKTVDCFPAGLRDRIDCRVGLSRQELLNLYREADLLVSASRTECQPLVVLDAMGAAVPFISTRVGCVEMLPGGVVVDDDSVGLTQAIQHLCREESLRKSLSQAGRRAAEEKYNWKTSMHRLEDLLLQMKDTDESMTVPPQVKSAGSQ